MDKNILEQLSLQEKAELTTGCDTWSSKSIPHLGIEPVRVSDGPNGLASPAESGAAVNGEQIKAVCFPSECVTASSFDVELLQEMGEEYGREYRAEGVDVLLGPGINIKRSPLCGRNFEYYSEDPFLAGELGAAFIKGVQSKGVGTCVKHFCANNQEYRRNDISSEIDERTLREIYLTAFEKVVKQAKPASIMAAYNKVNGTYCTESKVILDEILRKEWGFDGAVISDWGATHDRVAAVKAGCDLTMPADLEHTEEIIQAVLDGKLDEQDLDKCAKRIIRLAQQKVKKEGAIDLERGHKIARKVAEESYVLLKNDGILPLNKNAKVAFVGEFAKKPHYQGVGSSGVNCIPPLGAYEVAIQEAYSASYAQGYNGISTEQKLLENAIITAKEADIVVVFAGLLDVMEQEGNDRQNMEMPESHCTLIKEICKVNQNTIVVLHNGGPVEMPWIDAPRAVLETYLGGEAVGEATVRILFGDVNPSGHLAETFPKKLSDASSYLFYTGEGDKVSYSERFFVGYRYSSTKNLEPLFPFGHGLSYTEFAYSDLEIDRAECLDTDTVNIFVKVRNCGNRAGKAVVQLYVAPPRAEVIRPVRELKGFRKVLLQPNEECQILFQLSYRDYAHWSEDLHDWRVENGEYGIQICENADQVILEQHLMVNSTKPIKHIDYHITMPMKDLLKSELGYEFVNRNVPMMVYALVHEGFISEVFFKRLQEISGGELSIKAIQTISKNRELCSNEVYDIANVFGMSMDTFLNFISEEEKRNLMELMNVLNN